MATLPNNAHIFCTEYGLEPAVYNYNYGKRTGIDDRIVLINKSVKADSVIFNSNKEILVKHNRILYDKVVELDFFNGYGTIYVGRKSGLYIQPVFLGFGDKWKIVKAPGHPLNNTKLNIYDRPKIRSILNTYLTKRQDEVYDLLYKTRTETSGQNFVNVLTVIIEYKDEFLNLMTPYEEKFLPVPDGLLNANGSNGSSGSNGTDGTNTNPTNGNPTAANNNLLLGLGLLAVGTYALKKKKVI